MSVCEVVERVKDKDGVVVMEILDCGHRVMVKANKLKPGVTQRRCKTCSTARALSKHFRAIQQALDDKDIPF